MTVKNEPMLSAAKKFVEAYRWKGGFELECIVKGSDVYLIEINPRLPAWSYFATGVGVNLPANIVRKTFGLPLKVAEDYPAGKLYVRCTYELITDMEPFRQITMKGER